MTTSSQAIAPRSKPDGLLFAILFWTALVTGVLFWLPFVRCIMEGVEYRWALSPSIRGQGVRGDFWFIVAGVVFAIFLLYLGRRGARQPIHWLLLAFQFAAAAVVVRAAITHPEQLRFEGATFGIDLPLTVVAPSVFILFALLSAYWVWRDVHTTDRREIAAGWSRAGKIRLAIAVLLLPAEYILLRAPLGSNSEMIGVGLIFWQWILINRAMNPPKRSEAA
jgi:hypothetical protein